MTFSERTRLRKAAKEQNAKSLKNNKSKEGKKMPVTFMSKATQEKNDRFMETMQDEFHESEMIAAERTGNYFATVRNKFPDDLTPEELREAKIKRLEKYLSKEESGC